MENLERRIFPDTPVLTLLALRPLAMTVLEGMGVQPYLVPGMNLEDACRMAGLSWETLPERIRALERPARNSDWVNLPVSHLLDFLTAEHWEFINGFIPAIKAGFAAGGGGPEYQGILGPMVKAWPGFSSELIGHIAGEASFLFPKILRYAYCLKHDRVDPDFSDGSVKVFAAVHLLRGEEKQAGAIRDFLETASFDARTDEMDPPAAGLLRLLKEFHTRLAEHSRLEKEVLFPMAEAMERRLYDRSIAGNAASPIAHADRAAVARLP